MTGRPPERAELDTFLDPLLGFAHDMVNKQGGFHPFGATIGSDGQMTLNAAYTGDEHPTSPELIDLMVGGMRSDAAARSIRAAAICYDIRFQPEGGSLTDAIAVSMEHREGDRVLVVQPYSKGRFTGWKFGELIAIAPPEPRILVTTPSDS